MGEGSTTRGGEGLRMLPDVGSRSKPRMAVVGWIAPAV